MAHQLLIQPPHDQEGGAVFRGVSFCGPSVKGIAAMLFVVAIFGGLLILFGSILPLSLLNPHGNRFWDAVICAVPSAVFTALTVITLTALARILRSTA